MTVKHKQHIRMSQADAENYTGPEGELIVELETFVIRVQDGVTPGGYITLTRETADSLYALLIDFNETIDELTTTIGTGTTSAVNEFLADILIAKGPVIAIVTSLPAASLGDRYLIAHAGLSGIAVGQEDQVAEYTGAGWLFSGVAHRGHEVFNEDDDTKYYFDGSTWATTLIDETLLALAADITSLTSGLALKAPLANPDLTGTPTAPTAALGTNDTQIATTAFVQDALDDFTSGGFDSTIATNGTQTLASGLIIKWGHYAGGSSNPTVNFAAAFPNACLNVQLTAVSTSADTDDAADTNTVRYASLNNFDENGFSAWCSAEKGIEDVFHAFTGVDFYWFAIGH